MILFSAVFSFAFYSVLFFFSSHFCLSLTRFNVCSFLCELKIRRKITPLIIIWASSFDHFLHSFFLFFVIIFFSLSLSCCCRMFSALHCFSLHFLMPNGPVLCCVPSHMPAISIYNRNSFFVRFFIHTKCLSIQVISASFCISLQCEQFVAL